MPERPLKLTRSTGRLRRQSRETRNDTSSASTSSRVATDGKRGSGGLAADLGARDLDGVQARGRRAGAEAGLVIEHDRVRRG